MADILLQETVLGDDLPLRNRVVMSSMTRNRCVDDNKPGPAVVEHYAAKARDGVGLIIGEGTFVSANTSSFVNAPVLYREDHAEAWKKVTDAVHQEGGRMLYQAWHYGALESTGDVDEFENPQELIEQYRHSAILAKLAGFDGVELLAGGGYLINQFLTSNSNSRRDRYSFQPIENRCRFLLEVLDTIIEVWGTSRRTGIKICPSDDINNTAVSYAELSETYDHLIQELLRRDVAYITLARRGSEKEVKRQRDPRPPGTELPPGWEPLHQFGPQVKQASTRTALMVTTEYTINEASGLIKEGKIDFVQLGHPFVYNPDLITRIENGLPFAVNDRGAKVYYGPFQDVNEGYNDWPSAKS